MIFLYCFNVFIVTGSIFFNCTMVLVPRIRPICVDLDWPPGCVCSPLLWASCNVVSDISSDILVWNSWGHLEELFPGEPHTSSSAFWQSLGLFWVTATRISFWTHTVNLIGRMFASTGAPVGRHDLPATPFYKITPQYFLGFRLEGIFLWVDFWNRWAWG